MGSEGRSKWLCRDSRGGTRRCDKFMFEQDEENGERLVLQWSAEEFLKAAKQSNDEAVSKGLVTNAARCLERVLRASELTGVKVRVDTAIRLAEVLIDETTSYDYCIEVIGQGQVLAGSGRYHAEGIRLGFLEAQVMIKQGRVNQGVQKLDKLIRAAGPFDNSELQLVSGMKAYRAMMTRTNDDEAGPLNSICQGFDKLRRDDLVSAEEYLSGVLKGNDAETTACGMMASLGMVLISLKRVDSFDTIKSAISRLDRCRSSYPYRDIVHLQGPIKVHWLSIPEVDWWIKLSFAIGLMSNNANDPTTILDQSTQILQGLVSELSQTVIPRGPRHATFLTTTLATACNYHLACLATRNSWQQFEATLQHYTPYLEATPLTLTYLHTALAHAKNNFAAAARGYYDIMNATGGETETHLMAAIGLIFILDDSRELRDRYDGICSTHPCQNIRILWMLIILLHWDSATTRTIEGTTVSNQNDYAKAILSLANRTQSSQLLMFITVACAPFLDSWNEISQLANHGFTLASYTNSIQWKYAANLLILTSAQNLGTVSQQMLQSSASIENQAWSALSND